MIPEAVLLDPKLTGRDIRVFGILAAARRGPYVTIGERRIASRAHIARLRVRESIAKLTDRGHIEKSKGTKAGQRARYALTSTIFEKQVADAEKPQPVATQSAGDGKLRCSKCHHPMKRLPKDAMCSRCRLMVDVEVIARRTARHEAVGYLGKDEIAIEKRA